MQPTTRTHGKRERNGKDVPGVRLVRTLDKLQAIDELRRRANALDSKRLRLAERERRAQAIADLHAEEQRQIQAEIDKLHEVLFERFGVAP